MGRPKKSAPKHIEPEDEVQESPEEEPAVVIEPEDDEPTPAAGKALSKAAAVRDALAQGEESPEDGVAFIRKVHGIDMTRQMFSSYKAQQKARDAKQSAATPKAKPGRKPREAAPLVEGYVAPPRKPRSVTGETDLLAAMEAMKPLVAALGVEKVKRIADLLG